MPGGGETLVRLQAGHELLLYFLGHELGGRRKSRRTEMHGNRDTEVAITSAVSVVVRKLKANIPAFSGAGAGAGARAGSSAWSGVEVAAYCWFAASHGSTSLGTQFSGGTYMSGSRRSVDGGYLLGSSGSRERERQVHPNQYFHTFLPWPHVFYYAASAFAAGASVLAAAPNRWPSHSSVDRTSTRGNSRAAH